MFHNVLDLILGKKKNKTSSYKIILPDNEEPSNYTLIVLSLSRKFC